MLFLGIAERFRPAAVYQRSDISSLTAYRPLQLQIFHRFSRG